VGGRGAGFGSEGDGIGRRACGTVDVVQAAARQAMKYQLLVFRRIVSLFIERVVEKNEQPPTLLRRRLLHRRQTVYKPGSVGLLA